MTAKHFFHKVKPRKDLGTILYFPILFIYYESLFKIFTVGNFFSLGTVFTLLFSLVFGIVFYLISSMLESRIGNRIIAVSFSIIFAVIYLIEYFVYCQFKIFYDTGTVTGAAGDVAQDYLGETAALLLSFNGITKILLFFLPTVIYLIFGKKLFPAKGTNACRRIFVSILAAVILFADIGAISCSPLKAKLTKEYTFNDAVSNFGFLTGVCLDLFRPEVDSGFEDYGDDVTSSESEPDPVVYGENVMDIDFAALAASAPSDKIRNLDNYVASLAPSKRNEYTGLFKGKNLIMISAEAFSAEVIDKDLTPTLYRLATRGINFTDYYQPSSAGTTGGEYQNIFGLLPSSGGKSFKNTVGHNMYFTMGNQLDRLGYYGKAFHNNSYTYYDRHNTHVNLGYSDGFMGYGNGMEKYVKKCWPQSDLEMFEGTVPTYIDKPNFNVYYMTVSGHSNYGRSNNSMTSRNWDKVAGLGYSDTVKGYLAANLELEKAMTYLVSQLEENGRADDTVICISADHFPYGLDDAGGKLGNMPYLSELYGYNVTNAMQRDHNRLILWCGCLEEREPIIVSSPTSSLDIVPTLSNLFGTEFDSRLLPGRDALSDAEAIVFNTSHDWKTDLGTYTSSTGKFEPNEGVSVPDGYVDRIRSVVNNKIKFCSDVLSTDYYAHVFGN